MATSHFHQIPAVMRYVEMIWPDSILDIGAGIGKWGFLCRDRLDVLEGRYEKASWSRRIYGIELFEGYKNPIWDYYYDQFWAGGAAELLDQVPNVDLVLLCDVLSFLPKAEGTELLARLSQNARYALITTPIRIPECSDGKHDVNPATANHVSSWGPEDLSRYFFVVEDVGSTRVMLVDFYGTRDRPLTVEAAERYSFGALLRALRLKCLTALGLPRGRFIRPRAVRRYLKESCTVKSAPTE